MSHPDAGVSAMRTLSAAFTAAKPRMHLVVAHLGDRAVLAAECNSGNIHARWLYGYHSYSQ